VSSCWAIDLRSSQCRCIIRDRAESVDSRSWSNVHGSCPWVAQLARWQNVWNRIWFSQYPFIQFSKVWDESYWSILLRNEKGRCSPFWVVHLLQNTDFDEGLYLGFQCLYMASWYILGTSMVRFCSFLKFKFDFLTVPASQLSIEQCFALAK